MRSFDYAQAQARKGWLGLFAPTSLLRSSAARSFPPRQSAWPFAILGTLYSKVTALVTAAFTNLGFAKTIPTSGRNQANGVEESSPFRRARRLSAIILIIYSLTGCKYNFITDNKPLMLEVDIDRGPPIYRAGYHDGCTSALAAFGNSYQKTLYHLERNPEYQNDKMYNQIWKDAWGYCYMWIFAYNNEKTTSMYGKPLF